MISKPARWRAFRASLGRTAASAVLILAAAGLLDGCRNGGNQTTNPGPPPEDPAPAEIDAFGLIHSEKVCNLSLDFPATVLELHVREGERVGRGQPLLTLDLGEAAQQISRTEHDLRLARLELARFEQAFRDEQRLVSKEVVRIRNTLESSELELRRLRQERERLLVGWREGSDPQLRKLEGDLENAEKLYELASKELEGREALRRDGSISQVALDDFRKEVLELQKSVSDSRLSLESWHESRRQEAESLESDVARKQAEVENLRLELELRGSEEISRYEIQREKTVFLERELEWLRSRLNKPYLVENRVISEFANGAVYDIGYRRGETISLEKKMLSIMDLDFLYVEADVSEDFIKDIRLGAGARITPLADPKREYAGRVRRISALAVNKNGETIVPVELSLESVDEFLRPNFNVDVTIFRPEDPPAPGEE